MKALLTFVTVYFRNLVYIACNMIEILDKLLLLILFFHNLLLINPLLLGGVRGPHSAAIQQKNEKICDLRLPKL